MNSVPTKRVLILVAAMGAATAGAQSLSVSVAPAANFDFGVSAGYYGGLSGSASITARNLGDTGFGLRGEVSYTNLGDSALNDAGTTVPGLPATPLTSVGGYKDPALYGARESGRNVTLGLDALYHLGYDQGSGLGANLYAGVRYNFYRGALTNFETSTGPLPDSLVITSNQLGIGAGVAASYPIAGNLVLTGDLGVDHFFDAPITFNNPSSNAGPNTFRPGEAGYADADNTANRPKTVFKAKVGLALRF